VHSRAVGGGRGWSFNAGVQARHASKEKNVDDKTIVFGVEVTPQQRRAALRHIFLVSREERGGVKTESLPTMGGVMEKNVCEAEGRTVGGGRVLQLLSSTGGEWALG